MPHFQTRKIVAPTEAECHQLLDLYEAAQWWTPVRPQDLSVLTKMVQNSFQVWVIESPETGIIGMARVLGDGISDVYIQDVTILPEFRHQGLAAELLKNILASLSELNIDFIGLIAERNTENFYAAHGFEMMENARPMRFKRTTP